MIPTIYIDGVANGSTQNINTMDATIRFQFWSRLRGWTDEFGVRSPESSVLSAFSSESWSLDWQSENLRVQGIRESENQGIAMKLELSPIESLATTQRINFFLGCWLALIKRKECDPLEHDP